MKTLNNVITNHRFTGDMDLRVSVTQRREGFTLQVLSCEISDGFFILQPVGSINTMTSAILQNELEHIYKSNPKIILFDMNQVRYINSEGLGVILKVHQAMIQQCGRVGLMNFLPHIKKVFEIVNALPVERVFASRHELDSYLDSMQIKYAAKGHDVKVDREPENDIIWVKSNASQGNMKSIEDYLGSQPH